MGNGLIAVRCAGLRSARPKRPSNNEAPTPTVTVRPSGTTVGPRIPESEGGAPAPVGVGIPPVARKRERSVRVWSRLSTSLRFPAVTSKASTRVCRCGGGKMPVWYVPSNGTGGSRPCGSAGPVTAGTADPAAADRSAARAARTSPATPIATPTAPAPIALRRKDRRPGCADTPGETGQPSSAGPCSLMGWPFPARICPGSARAVLPSARPPRLVVPSAWWGGRGQAPTRGCSSQHR